MERSRSRSRPQSRAVSNHLNAMHNDFLENAVPELESVSCKADKVVEGGYFKKQSLLPEGLKTFSHRKVYEVEPDRVKVGSIESASLHWNAVKRFRNEKLSKAKKWLDHIKKELDEPVNDNETRRDAEVSMTELPEGCRQRSVHQGCAVLVQCGVPRTRSKLHGSSTRPMLFCETYTLWW